MRKYLFLLTAATIYTIIILSCGEKIKLPTETPPGGNLGDTLYLLVNPPWDAAHGYNFSGVSCLYFGHDTYLYVVDTGNNRILQLDAAGTVHSEFQIDHPISVSQDELMRLLVVTGEKKVYRIDVGPAGDRIPRVAFDYDNIPYSDTTILKHHNMIDNTDKFVSITDLPLNYGSYYVAVSSDRINDGRVLWFWNSRVNGEYTDSLFDSKFANAEADTFRNPVIITGNGITTTTQPNFISAYEVGSGVHLIVCQDSGSYPVHDMKYERQGWDRHWVYNYTHSPAGTDLLARGFFSKPKGATVDPQGNIYVVDSGPDRYAGGIKFSKQGELLKTIDLFQYALVDINDNVGVNYDWVEISPNRGGQGTATGLGTDSTIWVQMGITFNFYSVNYDSIDIASNGWCNFLLPGSVHQRPQIPSQGNPNALICPLGQPLNASANYSEIYYWHDQANNRFIVQYDSIPESSGNFPKTFQLILNASDSSIVFQYKYAANWGDSLIAGIENSNGTTGLQIPKSKIVNNYAAKFKLAVNLVSPSGITYDIYGDRRTVYIADTGNNRILRFKLSTDLEP